MIKFNFFYKQKSFPNFIQTIYTLDFDSITIQNTFNIQPKRDNSFTNLLFSNLLNNKIIGGYATWGYGSYVKYLFDLPYHYQIRIYCTLYFIDGWSIEDQFIIKIDETEYVYTINDIEPQQLTGKSDVDYSLPIFIRHEHYDELLTIKFTCLSENYNDSREKSCGMNQIFILYDRNVNYLCPQQNEFYQQTSQTCANCTTKGIGCIEYQSQAFMKCNYRCFTCSLDLNYCLSCDPALRRVFNNNQCICKDGYYELDDVPQCKKCLFPCLTCDKTQCLSCVDDRELELGKCNCRQGYQEINQQCLPICHSTCLTCDGVSKSNCLTCDFLINRYLVDKQCLCKNGYFEDEDQGCLKLCLNPKYCYACDELDQCIQCLPNQKRVLSNKQCDCQQDYQENPTTKLCEMICHYSCLSCSQPQSSTSCISCESKDVSFRELGDQSNCGCIDGYKDEGNQICAKIPNCHYSCDLCYESNNENLCIDCQSNRYMNENKQCTCKLGLKEIDQICVLDNVDNNQSSGNDNQNSGNDNQNSGDDNQSSGNDNQNSGNDNQNSGNDNQSNGNDNQNSGNDNQNSGNDNQNSGNDYQNGGNNNQNIIECDDGNDLPRDGCFNNYIEQYWYCTPRSQSQYSVCSRCHTNCIYCSLNSICELCIDGYYINNGDCLQCQSQCKSCNQFSSFCLECSDKSQNPINGICQKCKSGYYLIHDTCQSVCGDGIVVGEEECDDSNNNNLDGCNSFCKVESNYKCSDSSCIPLPEIKKEVNLQQNNQVIISLQNINSNCSFVSLWIEQISAENYQYNVSQFESTQDSGMKCVIDFLFQQDVKPFNLIHVLVKKRTRILSDSDLVELLVQPQKKYYYSYQQQEDANIMYQMYCVILYFFLGMIPISIFFNQFDHLCLDFVIAIQYLYYFNADFSIYLQQLLFIQIWPLIYINYPFSIYNMESIQGLKLQNRNQDYYFISNIWISFVFITSIYILKLILKKVRNYYQKILQIQTRPTSSKNFVFTFRNQKQTFENIKMTTEEKLLLAKKIEVKINQIYYRVLNIQQFDLAFSILLYLFCIQKSIQISIYEVANVICVILGCMFQIFYSVKLYRFTAIRKTLLMYYFNQHLTKILFIFFQLIFRENPLKATFVCFVLQIGSILCYYIKCRDYKINDLIFLLILLGTTIISYLDDVNEYIDFAMIGTIFIFILGNIIYVIQKIIRHYI